MSAGHYAQGKKAFGICGRCGQRALLNDLVFDGYFPQLRVHERCYESRHPQDRLAPVNDRVALWRPAPEGGGPTAPVLEGELETFFRLTEDGNYRITEDSEFRVLED